MTNSILIPYPLDEVKEIAKPSNMFSSLCTPDWAETLVYAHINEFSEKQLLTMAIFIRDQLKKIQASA